MGVFITLAFIERASRGQKAAPMRRIGNTIKRFGFFGQALFVQAIMPGVVVIGLFGLVDDVSPEQSVSTRPKDRSWSPGPAARDRRGGTIRAERVVGIV